MERRLCLGAFLLERNGGAELVYSSVVLVVMKLVPFGWVRERMFSERGGGAGGVDFAEQLPVGWVEEEMISGRGGGAEASLSRNGCQLGGLGKRCFADRVVMRGIQIWRKARDGASFSARNRRQIE